MMKRAAKKLSYSQTQMAERKRFARKSWMMADFLEVLVGVFHFSDKMHVMLPVDTAKLHQALFEVCSNPSHGRLVNGWVSAFEYRIFGKYCDGIDGVMQNLEMSDMIWTRNDESYCVLAKLHIYWHNNCADKLFSKRELMLLERLTFDLVSKLGLLA
jgi:hypothetical protein